VTGYTLRPRSDRRSEPSTANSMPGAPAFATRAHVNTILVVHSHVHQAALRLSNISVVPVVERVQFRKASKTIATSSIGQKYASTESVRLGARNASKGSKVAPGACANTSSRRDGAKRASSCVGFIMVSQESWLVKMDRIAVAPHHTTSITRERCHIVQGHRKDQHTRKLPLTPCCTRSPLTHDVQTCSKHELHHKCVRGGERSKLTPSTLSMTTAATHASTFWFTTFN